MRMNVVLAAVILVIGAVFDVPCSCQNVRGLRRRVEDLEEKQVELEERVEDLEEELASNAQDNNGNPVSPTNVEPTRTPVVPTAENIVTPLEVRREKMATGYRFTVRYVPHAQNIHIVYIFDSIEASLHQWYNIYYDLKGMPDDKDDGVMKVEFWKDRVTDEEYSHSLVYFFTDTQRLGIKVYMGPSSDDILETPVQVPSFPVTPTEQLLVYQPGEDTDMIYVNYTEWTHIFLKAVAYDADTAEFLVEDIRYSDFFNIYYQYSPGVGKTISGRLETSRHRYTGYVDISVVHFPDSPPTASAVEALEVTKRLIFRPAQQSGPFPDGSIGFPTDNEVMRLPLADGTLLHCCNITNGNPCQEILDVVTAGPMELSCEEIENDGTRLALSVTAPNEAAFDDYLKRFLVTVQNRTARQESSRVECRAVSPSGFVATRHLEVVYFIKPRILLDRSSASIMQNGTLSVTCVTTGQPAPTIVVHVEYGDSRYFYQTIPANQTTLSSDGAITTGTLDIDYGPGDTVVTRVTCLMQAVYRKGIYQDYLTSGAGAIWPDQS